MTGFTMFYVKRLVGSLAARYGLGLQDICRETQVAPELFAGTGPIFFPSDHQVFRLMRFADDLGYFRSFEIDDHRMAPGVLESLPPGSMDPLVWMLFAEFRNARTLADMLQSLMSRFRILGNSHRLWLESVHGKVRLCHDFYLREEGFTCPQGLFAWLYQEMVQSYELNQEDIEVRFARRGIRDEAGFTRLTGKDLHCWGDYSYFQFNRSPETVLNRNHNPALSILLAPAIDTLTRQLCGGSLVSAKVGRMLEDHLARAGDSLDIDATAAQLGMSRATLQRRLEEERTSFSDLRQASRLNRAKTLLASHDLSVSLIGDQLGFSSISTFSRSFKNLTGLSPLEFRTAVLEDLGQGRPAGNPRP